MVDDREAAVNDLMVTLERSQWDWFWVPRFVRVVDRPELCFAWCPVDLPVVNRVTRIRGAASQLDALVAEVSAAHSGVRSTWMVAAHADAGTIEAALTRGSYAPWQEYRAYGLRVAEHRTHPSTEHHVVLVADRTTLGLALDVEDRAFGRTRVRSEVEDRIALASCTGEGGRSRRFLVLDDTGRAVAAGGLNVHPALDLGVLWGGGTVPDARGRGAYTALLAARIASARQLGLSAVALYAAVDTSAPIVEAAGFVRGGPMWIWMRP